MKLKINKTRQARRRCTYLPRTPRTSILNCEYHIARHPHPPPKEREMRTSSEIWWNTQFEMSSEIWNLKSVLWNLEFEVCNLQPEVWNTRSLESERWKSVSKKTITLKRPSDNSQSLGPVLKFQDQSSQVQVPKLELKLTVGIQESEFQVRVLSSQTTRKTQVCKKRFVAYFPGACGELMPKSWVHISFASASGSCCCAPQWARRRRRRARPNES